MGAAADNKKMKRENNKGGRVYSVTFVVSATREVL
jgi:hypothetical protein